MGYMCAKYIKLTGNYKAVLGRAFEIIERCSAAAADVETAKVICGSDGSFWVVFYDNKNRCVAYTSEFKIDYNRRYELLNNAVRRSINSDIWDIYPGAACPLIDDDKKAITNYILEVVWDCCSENLRPSWLPAPEWELGRDPARSFTPFSPDEY